MKLMRELFKIKLTDEELNLTAKEFVLRKYPDAAVLSQLDEKCEWIVEETGISYFTENDGTRKPYLIFKYYKNGVGGQYYYYKNENQAWEEQAKRFITILI